MNNKNNIEPSSANEQILKLSLAQQDIYFDQLHQQNSPHYTVGGFVVLKDANTQWVKQAHQLLINNEQVFGIRINETDDGIVQSITADRCVELPIVDFSKHDNPKQASKGKQAR